MYFPQSIQRQTVGLSYQENGIDHGVFRLQVWWHQDLRQWRELPNKLQTHGNDRFLSNLKDPVGCGFWKSTICSPLFYGHPSCRADCPKAVRLSKNNPAGHRRLKSDNLLNPAGTNVDLPRHRRCPERQKLGCRQWSVYPFRLHIFLVHTIL